MGAVIAEKGEIRFVTQNINFKRREEKEKGIIISENALRVLERRYLRKNESGKVVETPEEMFRRVATSIAMADRLYNEHADVEATAKEFYAVMSQLEFMPNSPTLMNAGCELGQLSACFVLPVDDSMTSIFDAVKHTALIHQSGGGTGFSFSRLRPKNDMVKSTGGVASGPISFMTVFDSATETIKQGGTRRGANMGILRVDHPDILDFITAKKDNNTLNNFNISVALTETFMQAVEHNGTYNLINPRSKQIAKTISAKEVFDKIVDLAWSNGEPGIIFIDRINRDNPTPQLGEIESTNPCGEQPLLPYESCNLGSINLSRMTKDGHIDYEKLRGIIATAVHFLDNVIDVNRYPLPQIEDMTKGNRKIGLGVMGFADMLIQLGIPYDSPLAVQVAEELMAFIQNEARLATEELANSRGVFPNFAGSLYDKSDGIKVRNATCTTIAPTGTISIIAGCSSGIEPIFAVSYIRNVMDNDELLEVNPLFEEIAKREGFYSDELMKQVAKQGTVKDLDQIPKKWQDLFVTAHEISPECHIRMQAVFQKYTDNAVSKTVNFSNDATKDDVAKAYVLAYKLGCKGVTVYRDGSRESQVLNIESVNKTENKAQVGLTPRPRAEIIYGATRRMTTGCGNLYVTINEDEYGLFEVFTAMGKAGGCAASQAEAIGRLISLALRAGVDVESIIKQLHSVRCPSPAWEKGGMILSCADAIAKSMERYLKKKNGDKSAQEAKSLGAAKAANTEKHNYTGVSTMGACPDCGSMLEFESGCMVCRACGFSKCS